MVREADVPLFAGDLADLIRLDHIAFLDVVEAGQPDAAFEPGGDAADVIFESAQRRDDAVEDDHAVAQQAGPWRCEPSRLP